MAKVIGGSVGFSARNLPPDVMTVQFLLDCVPVDQGGPLHELAIDGQAGPMTVAAIRRFQAAQLGIADGRVDPLGKTLRRLQSFDPFPHEPLRPLPVANASVGAQSPGVKYGYEKYGYEKMSPEVKYGYEKMSPGVKRGYEKMSPGVKRGYEKMAPGAQKSAGGNLTLEGMAAAARAIKSGFNSAGGKG